jgi:hypothetical protein
VRPVCICTNVYMQRGDSQKFTGSDHASEMEFFHLRTQSVVVLIAVLLYIKKYVRIDHDVTKPKVEMCWSFCARGRSVSESNREHTQQIQQHPKMESNRRNREIALRRGE